MVYNFFDKMSKGSGIATLANRSAIKSMSNQLQFANELHRPIIRKFKRRKVYSPFKDNIWGFNLPDMQLISKYNKGIKFLLCVIDLFSKHAWVVSLKGKKGASIFNALQSNLSRSKRKANKI